MKGKIIRYTIKATIDFPSDYPEGITELLDRIREDGEADIETVELIEDEEKK